MNHISVNYLNLLVIEFILKMKFETPEEFLWLVRKNQESWLSSSGFI